MSFQRSGKTHKGSISGTETVSTRSLINYLVDAQKALEEAGEEDSALRFELAAEFFRDRWNPSAPLKFRPLDIGL